MDSRRRTYGTTPTQEMGNQTTHGGVEVNEPKRAAEQNDAASVIANAPCLREPLD